MYLFYKKQNSQKKLIFFFEKPTEQASESFKLTPEEKALAKKFMKGNPMDRMMDFQNNPESLKALSDRVQRIIFLDYAKKHPEETLNFAFLYLNKGFAKEVLERAALKFPEHAAWVIINQPDNPKYKSLYRFLIKNFGADKVQEYLRQAEVVNNRLKFFGWLGLGKITDWLHKWLTRR